MRPFSSCATYLPLHGEPSEVGASVPHRDISDGILRGVSGSQLAAGRFEPHRLEVFRDGEVEIPAKATLQGSDSDVCHTAEILDANGFTIVLLDELLRPLGDARSITLSPLDPRP